MIGETVKHIRFGEGRVAAYVPPLIEIEFQDGTVKKFVYPQAVGRFPTFTDADIMQQAKHDLEQAEALIRKCDAERMLESQRIREEAAKLQSEQIQKKKTAAHSNTAHSTMTNKKTITGGKR